MEEKCKKLHGEWMVLQKRLDGLQRWKKLKMQIPSEKALAAASKEDDETGTKSAGGTGPDSDGAELQKTRSGADLLARVSSSASTSPR